MRKQLSLLVAILGLLVSTSAYAINNPDMANYEIRRGTGGQQADAQRSVRLVRFGNRGANVSSLVSGDVVIWDTLSDDGVTIATTTTSADGAIAGIVCTTIPTADGSANTAFDDQGRRNWGYIITSGKADANVGAGGTNSNSIGDSFITSTDAGKITGVPALPSVGSKAESIAKARGGFFFDAGDTTSTTVEVYVRLE